MNELILEKYFKDGKKQIEIAKELNISEYIEIGIHQYINITKKQKHII